MPPSATPDVILASQSPRRRELLDQMGLAYRTFSSAIDERCGPKEAAEPYALRMAREKALVAVSELGRELPVLAADTVVVVDGAILGKPADQADATAMLERLSGRSHHVISALALVDINGAMQQEASLTAVSFRPLKRREIQAYVATGESMDKAGAYAIQGLAAAFIARIEGSYSGVMGLPLYETAELLRHIGIDCLNTAGAAT